MSTQPEECTCRFCRRFDLHHREERTLAQRSVEAQTAGDYRAAAELDRLRTVRLDAAGRCLELCARKV